MRIDLGNFGNNQRQVVSTQVNRGDVTALADAQINAARQQGQTAQQIGQAWGRVADTMTSVGQHMEQRNAELAQQKAAIVSQQKQLHAQGVIQEASDLVDNGTLKAADVQKFYNDGMAKFHFDPISGLHGRAQEAFDASLSAVDQRMQLDVGHLYKQAHKVETRAAVDELASNNERLTMNGGDLAKGAAVYDTPTFQANLREAYGAQSGAKLVELKANLYKNGAMNAILNNRDSYSGLSSLQQQITDPNGQFYGKLDATDQLQILGQIDSRKGNLEAKAEAAAARAESMRARAEAHQDALNNRAQAAVYHAQEWIAAGNVPDQAYIDQLTTATKGTTFAQAPTALLKMSTDVQKFGQQPLAVQEAQLTQQAASMQHGTNPQQQEVFQARQKFYEARKKALTTDPITAISESTGNAIPELPWAGIRDAKTPEDRKAARQAFAAVVYQREAMSKQARQQTKDAPNTVFTAQEMSENRAYLKSLGPNEQMSFLSEVANAGGHKGFDIVKEITGDDAMVAATYHMVTNPKDPTGGMIAEGNRLINDPKSSVKAPSDKDAVAGLNDMYGSAIPASQVNTVIKAANGHYVSARLAKSEDPHAYDDDDYKESMRAAVGDVLQYGKSKIVVPSGTDANTFRTSIYNAFMQQPNGAAAIANIESGQARLVMIGAKTYALTNPAGGPIINPATGQPSRIELP